MVSRLRAGGSAMRAMEAMGGGVLLAARMVASFFCFVFLPLLRCVCNRCTASTIMRGAHYLHGLFFSTSYVFGANTRCKMLHFVTFPLSAGSGDRRWAAVCCVLLLNNNLSNLKRAPAVVH